MAKYLIQVSNTDETYGGLVNAGGRNQRAGEDELLELLNGDADVSYHGSRNGDAYAIADLPDEETLVRLSAIDGITVVGMHWHSPRISNGPWYVKSGLPK